MAKAKLIATRPYERRIVKLLPPDERDRMETAVAINPEAHPIVPGTKGVRKARWSQRARRSRVARDIISGLKDAVAFARGEITLGVRVVNVPNPVDVRALRSKLGLSQSEFAAQYGMSLRTLQEWEQGRTNPDGAVRAYLTVIDRNPQAVIEALTDR
jgi:putative transcriptional regulator